MDHDCPTVALDTNVFVAAGFRRESAAGRVVDGVRSGRLRMVWNEATRRETRAILERIPPLSWTTFSPLFAPENEYAGPVEPDRFASVPDPDDRKFAALAHATGAILISGDDDLLAKPHRLDVLVLSPGEFLSGSWKGI